jgi:hypothetical protein
MDIDPSAPLPPFLAQADENTLLLLSSHLSLLDEVIAPYLLL